MIGRLSGVCVAKYPGGIVLDVQGVGYDVEVTEPVLAELDASGSTLVLWTHTHVREDQLRLFGFPTYEERSLFTLLLSLSGVGPKHAMAMLARLDVASVLSAVEREDADTFETIPGIGASTAKRIVLELKPKLKKLKVALLTRAAVADGLGFVDAPASVATESSVAERTFGATRKPRLDPRIVADLQSALANFGYKDKEIAAVVRRYEQKPPSDDLGALIRMALSELSKPAQSALEEMF